MNSPIFPVKLNRAIQLRRLNCIDSDDLQQLVSFARISETEPFVQSKNQAIRTLNVKCVKNWYGQQMSVLDKLDRSQNAQVGRLEKIHAEKKKLREKKAYESAILETLKLAEIEAKRTKLETHRAGTVPKLNPGDINRTSSMNSNNLQIPCLNKIQNQSFPTLQLDSIPSVRSDNRLVPTISVIAPEDISAPTDLVESHENRDNISIILTDHSIAILPSIEDNKEPIVPTKHKRTKQPIYTPKQRSLIKQSTRIKKAILAAPFNSYRKDRKSGEVIIRLQNYQRKEFLVPTSETSSTAESGADKPSPHPAKIITSRNNMLRKRYNEDIDRQEKKIKSFKEALDRLAAWDATSYIQSLQPKAVVTSDRKDSLQGKKFQHIDIFGKYYNDLLKGLDPNSAEAMKYCRYIRDADTSDEVDASNHRPRSCRSARSIVL